MAPPEGEAAPRGARCPRSRDPHLVDGAKKKLNGRKGKNMHLGDAVGFPPRVPILVLGVLSPSLSVSLYIQFSVSLKLGERQATIFERPKGPPPKRKPLGYGDKNSDSANPLKQKASPGNLQSTTCTENCCNSWHSNLLTHEYAAHRGARHIDGGGLVT